MAAVNPAYTVANTPLRILSTVLHIRHTNIVKSLGENRGEERRALNVEAETRTITFVFTNCPRVTISRRSMNTLEDPIVAKAITLNETLRERGTLSNS